MTDMRNVNNWHWVNKDCRVWAKDYFHEKLVGLSCEKNKSKVTIDAIDECNGDVDLNQRKGKLIAIYDVALKLSWSGQLSNGNKVFGHIQIPEIAYDTDYDDYVFNIQVNSSQDDIKKLIRTDLVPLLRDRFSNFTNDLIARHSSDLYAAPSTPELKQRKIQPLGQLETKPIETVVKTTQMTDEFEFKHASARQVYEALLDPKRANVWSQGKSSVSKKIKSEFRLFDGNVHGTLLKTVPFKTIEKSWRFKSWPKDHYSSVSISFNETDTGVKVKVNQKGIPLGQEDQIKINWKRYYWSPIQACLDQAQFDHLPFTTQDEFNTTYIYLIVLFVSVIIGGTAYLVAPHY